MNTKIEEIDGKYYATLDGEMDTVAAVEAEKVLKGRLRDLNERLDDYDKRWSLEVRNEQRADVMIGEVLPAFEEYESFILTLGKSLSRFSPTLRVRQNRAA